MKRRLYFDHAATSVPKPIATIEAMHEHMLHAEASVGRGAYRSSVDAAKVIGQLRAEIAYWIGAASAREITLQGGGTEALNLALFGLLRSGDHVVTSAAEHNSVLRPLHELSTNRGVELTIVDVDKHGSVDADAVMNAVKQNTRLVTILHAANVNGAVQPIEAIGSKLKQAFAPETKPIFFSDAAQSFGYLPVNVERYHLDALGAPGHKGGQGPLGTGFLYLRESLHHQLRPLIFGGTGSRSDQLEMPTHFPEAFEAGNMNVPAFAGWLAGLKACRADRNPDDALSTRAADLQRHAVELYRRLETIAGIRIIGKPAELVLPIASVEVEGLPADEAAAILDSEFGIEVRTGLHCAALIHQSIGSPPDGTLRISCGTTTTNEDMDELIAALQELTAV
ncbi:aminotransferase class V-fold PLP-dependent enzyme [Rhodopirellula sp. MGV]|uniref:aminotransferase class V-fold PLP-dependent enzyme n=1 Tax=Rhodopirellula sp. MGV TaxID=2023130 RepID=UPI000B97163F|nr:aminotransferase class V-fold PLP-dependent enzyme [Rhodopirellula sp. MGV]OYP35186.1 hypothetical protein CGZ80_12365 [Rhodopirellula sp. MGV]PNY37800.1 aminotransferase class V-fold PLP-dependent enzyme [Rhodopirellula baltica]